MTPNTMRPPSKPPSPDASRAAWASAYVRDFGLALVPIPPGSKAPKGAAWNKHPVRDPERAERRWKGNPRHNLGALLGSSGIVSFDVDALEYTRRALQTVGIGLDEILDKGVAVEGNPEKAKRFFRMPDGETPPTHKLSWPADPATAPDKSGKRPRIMVLELRAGDGVQDVLPPSIHPGTRRPYRFLEGRDPWTLGGFPEMPPELLRLWREWDGLLPKMLSACPWARVNVRELNAAARQLGGDKAWAEVRAEIKKRLPLADVLARLGVAVGAGKFSCPIHPPDNHPSARTWTAPDGTELFVCAHGRGECAIGVETKDGNLVADVIALEAFRRNLPPGKATAELARELGIALPLGEGPGTGGSEGAGEAGAGTGVVPLGQRDPTSEQLVLSPKRTLPTAEAFVREFHTLPEGRTFHSWAGLPFAWQGNRYAEVEDGALRNRLLTWLHDALHYVVNRKTGELQLAPFEANPSTVNAALESILAYTHLPGSTTPPAWLDDDPERPDPREVLVCRTMGLHIPTGKTFPTTPALFTTSALPFDYDPLAPTPDEWIRFLVQLWGPDSDSTALLQEWFGYCLTPDTSQQKMLLLIGPRRSGKGTIGRVLAALLGLINVCGPTISSLAGPFGLQPLIGKSLAVVSDAHFTGRPDQAAVTDRLLCISGEDPLTIDIKHRPSVTMKLPARVMFLANELPRLSDASSALSGRFLLLKLEQSFYGKEDPALTDRLLKELPGILKWAIAGWRRLHHRGRFVQPESAAEAVRQLEDLGSPIKAFLREACVIGPVYQVAAQPLYEAWVQWCKTGGRDHPGNIQTFGRDLLAALPGLRQTRPREGEDRSRRYAGVGLRTQMVRGGPQWSADLDLINAKGEGNKDIGTGGESGTGGTDKDPVHNSQRKEDQGPRTTADHCGPAPQTPPPAAGEREEWVL